MFGDVGLGGADGGDEGGHVELPTLQGVEDADADRLTQRAKAGGDEVNGFNGQRLGSGSLLGHRHHLNSSSAVWVS